MAMVVDQLYEQSALLVGSITQMFRFVRDQLQVKTEVQRIVDNIISHKEEICRDARRMTEVVRRLPMGILTCPSSVYHMTAKLIAKSAEDLATNPMSLGTIELLLSLPEHFFSYLEFDDEEQMSVRNTLKILERNSNALTEVKLEIEQLLMLLPSKEFSKILDAIDAEGSYRRYYGSKCNAETRKIDSEDEEDGGEV